MMGGVGGEHRDEKQGGKWGFSENSDHDQDHKSRSKSRHKKARRKFTEEPVASE